MKILTIMVLWTWGITPLWVNIVGTCLLGVGILVDTLCAILKMKGSD